MRFPVPMLAAALAGCATTPTVDGVVVDGLWAFELSVDQPELAFTCAENYLEASCREVGVVDPGDGVEFTFERSATPASFFAEVLGTSDGRFLLVLDGFLLEGDPEGEDGRTITFGWSGENAVEQALSRDGEFQIGSEETRTSSVDVTFALGEDGVATGTMSQVLAASNTVRQTDESDDPTPGFEDGMELAILLQDDVEEDGDDGRVNFADEDDCDGDTCEISATESGSVAGTFTAVRVAREEGWPGAGSYDEPANPSGPLGDFLPIFGVGSAD